MSAFTKMMRSVPVGQRPFGYIYVDSRASLRMPYQVYRCEIEWRQGDESAPLGLQILDMRRAQHRYGLMVFPDGDMGMDDLILATTILYYDNVVDGLEQRNTRVVDLRFGKIANWIIYASHAIIFENLVHYRATTVQDELRRIYLAPEWYLAFNATQMGPHLAVNVSVDQLISAINCYLKGR